MHLEESMHPESRELLEMLELAGEIKDANFLAENRELIVELATKDEFFYSKFKEFFVKYADSEIMGRLIRMN